MAELEVVHVALAAVLVAAAVVAALSSARRIVNAQNVVNTVIGTTTLSVR